MTFKFNKTFFVSSLLLLFIEIGIAVYLHEGFIRHTFGDFLVVILIYCFLRSFIEAKPYKVAIAVLIFSFFIEFSQRYNLLDYLGLRDSKLAVIILGSTFEIKDLIAYTLGILTIYIIDKKMMNTT